MNESTTKTTRHFTGCAQSGSLGSKTEATGRVWPTGKTMRIAQKMVKHTSIDKLHDTFISLLARAHRLVEINTRLRRDPGLQAAFGRNCCAEQSVVQGTLDSCTAANVSQMEQALDTIYRQHSQGYRHNYAHDWQILDVDMSGLSCGKKRAFASKDYFTKQRNRRGRQWSWVLASRYDEVVVDRLFDGKM